MKSLILTIATMITLAASAQDVYMHTHMGEATRADVINHWVTNNGTCRTIKISEDGTRTDVTLNVMIDNDSTMTKENDHSKIKDAMERIPMTDGWYVAVPIEFDVTGDESIVDHYELCGYNHLKNNTYPIMSASDKEWASNDILQTATLYPTNTMYIEKQEGEGPHHYECFTVDPYNPQRVWSDHHVTTNFTTVPTYYVGSSVAGDIIISCYIKVYYNNGLEPTYHSLNNVKYSIQKIVTAVDDLNTEVGEAQYFDLMGNKVACPTSGIFIKKVGNKSTKVRF